MKVGEYKGLKATKKVNTVEDAAGEMCIRDRHYIAQIGTGNYNEQTSEQ